MTAPRASLLASLVVMTACAMPPQGELTGTWKATSGTTTLSCDGKVTTYPLPASQTDSWNDGQDGTATLTSAFGSLTAATVQNTASLPASSEVEWLVSFPGSGPVSPTTNLAAGTLSGSVSVSAYRFEVAADGHTASETFAGTASILQNGVVVACGMSETAAYTKLAN